MSTTPPAGEPSRRPDPRRDLVSGVGLLAIATLYFLGTRSLPGGRGEPGPAFFPLVLAAALAILAVVLLAGGVRAVARSRRSIREPGLKPRATWTATLRARAVFLRRSVRHPGLKPRATPTATLTTTRPTPTSGGTAPGAQAVPIPVKGVPANTVQAETVPPDAAAPEPAMRRGTAWKAAAAAALSAAYVALFQPLGFVASTWIYTFSIAALDRGASRRALFVVPAVSTLLAYLLFRVALGVGLPRGPFG